MESFGSLLMSLSLGILLLRLVWKPAKLALRLGLHSLSGLVCLWILNGLSGITGFSLPVNAVTALTAGVLGIPGLGLIAILELL